MNRIKELREQQGKTLKEVADWTGLSFSMIARIERGERDIPGYAVEPLKKLFGLKSTAELFLSPTE